ncbi:dihydroorotase [Pseudohyphozyma bogoriensis]|nr:dihydroorotase [Pseudohyphozyma bogoriensis]
MVDTLRIASPFDAHVHLRQGNMAKLVVPHVAQGGVKLAYVMPNTIPPLSTPAQSIAYLKELQAIDPVTTYLPTLYLTTSLTPAQIREAKAAGVVGVKSYPRGVTTNSDGGVGMEGYGVYDGVFAEMEKEDMVLNLHGEVPSDVDAENGACVLDAEPRFLPHLLAIHAKFPKLRIVLEHCTTSAAVECVKTLPSNVCATITPHHLLLTIDGAVSTSLGFCKPLAKYPADRAALRRVVAEGHPQFFLGSDSAPHPSSTKLPALHCSHGVNGEEELTLPSPCAAGIYTSPTLIPLTAHIFEKSGIPLENLENFVSNYGRKFYGYPADAKDEIVLQRCKKVAEKAYGFVDDKGEKEYVIPFEAGKEIGWEIAA